MNISSRMDSFHTDLQEKMEPIVQLQKQDVEGMFCLHWVFVVALRPLFSFGTGA